MKEKNTGWNVELLIQQGRDYLVEGRIDRAKEVFLEAIRRDPSVGEVVLTYCLEVPSLNEVMAG